MNGRKRICTARGAALMLALLLSALLLPVGAQAQGHDNVVRVGWYESPFNTTDELGRRSGYAYEYQQKIAAFTGWTYEYVEGTWPELLQMLKDGRIDLLSDVSYTEERTEQMLFSSLPMGTEDYIVFTAEGSAVSMDDISSFNGKKVGINRGSIQIGCFRDWAAANGIECEIVDLSISEEEMLSQLRRGVIDMLVAPDTYFFSKRAVPVCKVGSSDFFFAVSNQRPELLSELNLAMSRVQDEDRYYNARLNEKYLQASAVNRYLTAEESAWLTEHGTVRVGYQDNYLAFCASDPQTGELTGALRDYLHVASDCLENAHIDFAATAYPSAAAAMEAMKAGEVDCVFPANLTDYDGEVEGFFMTPPIMRTDMSAVIRSSELDTFESRERVIVAVNSGNPNYDKFLLDHFPDWRAIYYKDTAACLKAIAEGNADTLLMSAYRFNNIAALCQEYRLTSISTGVEMDYYFAVRREDTALYSILSKVAGSVPESTINSALTWYYTEDAKLNIPLLLWQNRIYIAILLLVMAIAVAVQLVSRARAERKARANQALIAATEIDEITGLYNKRYFYEYAERLRREQPDKPMDAAVMNVEHFHTVNALHGRHFGDQVLRGMGAELLAFLDEHGGIAGHAEADHFAVYCPHMEDPHTLLYRLQNRLDLLSPNISVRLRMGVAPWQKDTEPAQLVEMALAACSLARGNYNNRLVVFDESVREKEAREQRLLNDLRPALENREFEVYYQPKYDIQAQTPRLVSAEALVRWQHPELGMIPPNDFIPLLEKTGRISAVDKYVWEEAARQVAAWRDKYGVTLPVSVNLSRLDVFDPSLEAALETLLDENGLKHADLKLEVTESACAENHEQVVDVIEHLRSLGFEIEMDDFGSGCSSLNMLSDMPIDVLKMDRVFVSNMEYEEKNRQLVELIVGIAKNLKIPVIAEGVENERQLELLRGLGCSLVQGFYFSRPLPAGEFEEKILKGNTA